MNALVIPASFGLDVVINGDGTVQLSQIDADEYSQNLILLSPCEATALADWLNDNGYGRNGKSA